VGAAKKLLAALARQDEGVIFLLKTFLTMEEGRKGAREGGGEAGGLEEGLPGFMEKVLLPYGKTM